MTNNEFGKMPDMSAMTGAVTAYQNKLLEIAQANTQFAFEYARALSAVRSPTEWINIKTEYGKKRMEMITQQTKELAEMASKG